LAVPQFSKTAVPPISKSACGRAVQNESVFAFIGAEIAKEARTMQEHITQQGAAGRIPHLPGLTAA
jgi:hypothetical protein